MKRIVLTPGEPAGIGPDIVIKAACESWTDIALIALADPGLIKERALQLGINLNLHILHDALPPKPHLPNHLNILPVNLKKRSKPGVLSKENANYVKNSLEIAAQLCLEKKADALVTGPIQKSILNEAGIPFTGHTEFLADYCRVPRSVMLFVVDKLRVALATTHLPLTKVSDAITKESLVAVIEILREGLKKYFHLNNPCLLVCGLNPHAGENGQLGTEEIAIITPVINQLRNQGYAIKGPLPADTLFTPEHLSEGDAVLAMYHDQALPVVKSLGFGKAVNVTLGLPFLRTSVDHGTALTLAGTGKADASSLISAIKLAENLLLAQKR